MISLYFSRSSTGSHTMNPHISMKRASELGILVTALEDNSAIQDSVLSVHHAYIQTVTNSSIFKLIENDRGIAFAQQVGSAPN